MAEFSIKIIKDNSELYFNGNFFVPNFSDASTYASAENATKQINSSYARDKLESYLVDGYKVQVVEYVRVELQGVTLNLQPKSISGFVIMKNGSYYCGKKNPKYFSYYLFDKRYSTRTVFKTKKEAERCLTNLIADYKETAIRMNGPTDESYWKYYDEALTATVEDNH